MIAQAQSGTGKTATFAISILQQIELDLKATQALVLAPTRELAQQVRSHQQAIGSPSCPENMVAGGVEPVASGHTTVLPCLSPKR